LLSNRRGRSLNKEESWSKSNNPKDRKVEALVYIKKEPCFQEYSGKEPITLSFHLQPSPPGRDTSPSQARQKKAFHPILRNLPFALRFDEQEGVVVRILGLHTWLELAGYSTGLFCVQINWFNDGC
jgi:hypothetical protein